MLLFHFCAFEKLFEEFSHLLPLSAENKTENVFNVNAKKFEYSCGQKLISTLFPLSHNKLQVANSKRTFINLIKAKQILSAVIAKQLQLAVIYHRHEKKKKLLMGTILWRT